MQRLAILLSVVTLAVAAPGCRLLSFTVACENDSGCGPAQQCIDGACLDLCTDPTSPVCDADEDGVLNEDDPAPRDPCSPDVDALACSVGDADNDGTTNDVDPDSANACVPDPDAPTCESGDADGDGTVNGDDLGILLAAWGQCPTAG